MKKIKKIVCIAVAICTLLACTGVAFATWSYGGTWGSTICLDRFTTTNSINKPSGNWIQFDVWAWKAEWPDGDPDWDHCLYATPKSSTGYVMGPETLITEEQYDIGQYIDCTQYSSLNYVKLLIRNPHKGTNMESNGHWFGEY